MGQILFYDDNKIMVFDCFLFDIQMPEYKEIDASNLEDIQQTKRIIRAGTTATASIKLGKPKAELDPTTMKRIAKYNLDKDLEELNRQIKSREDRLKFLNEEMETKEKKLNFMKKICQKIWNDNCFDEYNYIPNNDYEESEWE